MANLTALQTVELQKKFSYHTPVGDRKGQLVSSIAEVRSNGLQLGVVPVLYSGPLTGEVGYKDGETGEWLTQPQDWAEFDVPDQKNPRFRFIPEYMVEWLKRVGSQAAPGFMNPEGIVVFHTAASMMFKATILKDGEWKGKQ